MCDSRTKKLTHRPGKILLKKHVILEKGKKFHCFFFVFTCKNLIHAIFLKFQFHFPQNPGPCQIPGPGQLSNVKSLPPGQVFWANPWGLPGAVYPVGIDWDIRLSRKKYENRIVIHFIKITGIKFWKSRQAAFAFEVNRAFQKWNSWN